MSREKNKRPWSGFGYLVLVTVAILAAWFLLLPIGMQIRDVFQRLTDAFSHK